MPLLEQQTQQALTRIKIHVPSPSGKKPGRYPLPYDRELVVIYGMWRGWTDKTICRACNMSPNSRNSIYRIRRQLYDWPRLIFRHNLYQRGPNLRRSAYKCELCAKMISGNEHKIRVHVARHLFSEDIIRLNGVDEIEDEYGTLI